MRAVFSRSDASRREVRGSVQVAGMERVWGELRVMETLSDWSVSLRVDVVANTFEVCWYHDSKEERRSDSIRICVRLNAIRIAAHRPIIANHLRRVTRKKLIV